MEPTLDEIITMVEKAAQELDWGVGHETETMEEEKTRTMFTFTNRTSGGMNFEAVAFMYDTSVDSLTESLYGAYDSYDPDEEARLYVTQDVPGKPKSVKAIVENCGEVSDMLFSLWTCLSAAVRTALDGRYVQNTIRNLKD